MKNDLELILCYKKNWRRMSKLSKAWRGFLERKFVRGTEPVTLNRWQQAFCEWNSQPWGISRDESLRRFRSSCAALRGGHSGNTFGEHFPTFLQLDAAYP